MRVSLVRSGVGRALRARPAGSFPPPPIQLGPKAARGAHGPPQSGRPVCRVFFALMFALVAVAPLLRAAPDLETGRPFIQAFTPRDYCAHQQVWMGAQAPDGVMWFGNSHSVLSYDGATWRRIEVPGTSWVRAIAFGPDGRLYAGGTDELGFIAPGPDGAPRFTSLLE